MKQILIMVVVMAASCWGQQKKAATPAHAEIISVSNAYPDIPVDIEPSVNRAAAVKRFDAAVALTAKLQDDCQARQRELVDLERKNREDHLIEISRMKGQCDSSFSHFDYAGRLAKVDHKFMRNREIKELQDLLATSRDIVTTTGFIRQLKQKNAAE
jgi:hypothetical protein